jgi:TRAP-type C4-dicarboxylate transport system permease small subunit
MDRLLMMVSRVSRFLRALGAVILAGMMFLTVADVILRYLGKPILGSYELIAMAGALVIGFILPQNSLNDQNVYVDSFVNAASPLVQKVFMLGRRILGVALFILLAYGMFRKGAELNEAAEVSNVLHIPLCVLGYGLAACSFVQALALTCLLAKTLFGGTNDE